MLWTVHIMTTADILANPNVLNTTALSNFASIDQLWVVAGLSRIRTVPVVREELHNVVDDHFYLQSALDILDEEIPIATVRIRLQTAKQSSATILLLREAQGSCLVKAEK